MNIENFEFEKKEDFTSRISLSFYRHGEKEPWERGSDDIALGLTQEGRQQAIEKGKEPSQGEGVVALGGIRKRTLETAGIIAAGKRGEITGKESEAELKEKIEKNIKAGELVVEDRLDFDINFESEYGNILFRAINSPGFIKFIVEKSDDLARKYGDKKSFTYSRSASSVAEIISRYIGIGGQWDELVRKNKESKYPKTWEIILGTHQGISESFLSKLIEKTKGPEERNRFLEALNDQGFENVEGFGVEILNNNGERPTLRISYKKSKEEKKVFEYNENINPEILKEIINEK